MEPYRTREPEAPVSPVIDAPAVETPGVVHNVEDRAIGKNLEQSKESELDNWELQNGKYGLDYMGIKEIAKEFPMKMQFSYIDSFIKSEMAEKGYDKTPTSWQDVLKGIEEEIGTDKNKSTERLSRIYNYLKTLSKYREIKTKRDSFKKD